MLTLPRHLSFFFPPSKLLWPMHACYTTPFTHTPLPHSHQSFFFKKQNTILHLTSIDTPPAAAATILKSLFLPQEALHLWEPCHKSVKSQRSVPGYATHISCHKKKLINKHEKKLMETTLSLSLYFFAPLKASHHNFFLFNSQGCFGTQHSSFLALSPAAFAPIHTGA